MKGYIVLMQVETELTKEALVADVRQTFMRHAPEVKIQSVTASRFLDLDIQWSPT